MIYTISERIRCCGYKVCGGKCSRYGHGGMRCRVGYVVSGEYGGGRFEYLIP